MKKFAFALSVCALSFSSFANADPTNGPQHGSSWIRPDETDYCVISIVPRWRGVFHLYVKNVGSTRAFYRMTAR